MQEAVEYCRHETSGNWDSDVSKYITGALIHF